MCVLSGLLFCFVFLGEGFVWGLFFFVCLFVSVFCISLSNSGLVVKFGSLRLIRRSRFLLSTSYLCTLDRVIGKKKVTEVAVSRVLLSQKLKVI